MLTVKQLDDQNDIQLDGWVDVNSSEVRCYDEDRSFTKGLIRDGLENGWLGSDMLGRLWIKPNAHGGKYLPLHFEAGNKLLGYRMTDRAVG